MADNIVLFKYGTRAQYDRLKEKKENALYFLTDTGEFLRGSHNMAQANYYEGFRQEGEKDEDVIARVLGDTPLVKNDVFIVKTLIADDNYSFTAYYYDKVWHAMDGNYSANNIYFDKDFVVTESIGTIKELPNGQTTLSAKGKNLKDVLTELLAKESKPEIIQPSITVAADKMKSYEVGTLVIPEYITTFDGGKYQYGPDTGVVLMSWKVTDTKGQELKAAAGFFDELQVKDDTHYKITATATYGDGMIPNTNFGNKYADGQIKAGSASNSSEEITGHRSFFYGATKSDTIDSDVIRGLTNGGAYDSEKVFNVSITEPDCTAIVVAWPAEAGREGLKEVLLTTSMNIDITSEYIASDEVEVEGANGYVPQSYKVYIYKPAKLSVGQTHKITMA